MATGPRLALVSRAARAGVAVMGIVILAVLSILTHERTGVSSDPIALWRASLRMYPEHSTILTNLANPLLAEKQAAEALTLLETAAVVAPDHASDGALHPGPSLCGRGTLPKRPVSLVGGDVRHARIPAALPGWREQACPGWEPGCSFASCSLV